MAINKSTPKKNKTQMAKEMGICRQSLYYNPKLPAKDARLKIQIQEVMSKHKRYGHKRIADELGINKKRILRVMKLFGLKPLRNRKSPFKPEDKNQAPMTVPNLLPETIIDAPNVAWGSDFTYLPFFGKFIYLATIIDLFTREIVGWVISARHNADLVCQAMTNALKYHNRPQLAHSDQGSEYRSSKYQKLLESVGIKCSMSKKGSPWQNGKQESFYSEFKLELGHPEAYATLGELIEAIARQIHYYNNERIHTALKCPPAVFAEKYKTTKTSTQEKIEALTQFKCVKNFERMSKIEKTQKILNFQDTIKNVQSV